MTTRRSAVAEIQDQLDELRALTYLAQGENVHEHTDQISSALQRLIKVADEVVGSADDTGCTEDMTVVSKAAVERLADETAGRRSS